MESHFENLTPAAVAHLRSRDPAITAIRQRGDSGHPVSFAWLRKTFMQENHIQASLKSGRAILSSTDQLNQYLWSYGPMIKSQWDEVCSWPTLSLNKFRLIDYGCGQGLAGLLLFGRLGLDLINLSSKVVLIEPSDVALVRAEAVYRCLVPACSIRCVPKKLDELSANDLASDQSIETVHVFSNVLDIEGFDQIGLFRKVLHNGRHTVLVASHDRDFDGGTPRIDRLKAELMEQDRKHEISITRFDFRKFKCTNPNQARAIGWILRLDVTNA